MSASKVIHVGPEAGSCRYVLLLPLQRNKDGDAWNHGWAQTKSRDHLMPLVKHRKYLFELFCFVVPVMRGPPMNMGDVKGVEELIYCVRFDLT